jgi:hypothetical protein
LATARVSDETAAVDFDTAASSAWAPKFPAAWAVPLAVGTLWDAADASSPVGAAAEGPQWFATIAPGSIAFGRVNRAREQRTAERETYGHKHGRGRGHTVGRQRKRIDLAVGWAASVNERNAQHSMWQAGLLDCEQWPERDSGDLDPGCDPLSPGKGRSRITEWSTKSRVKMIKRLSTLDYEPFIADGTPAMVTLTLPDGWQTYAPTGAEFKRLLRLFVKRYERAWARRLRGLWKLEFQERGAPHCHILMVPPHGQRGGQRWREWFASNWADIVTSCEGIPVKIAEQDRAKMIAVHSHRKASADYAEGMRASDPKRIAVYFLKHNLLSDKEYQHIVPRAWQEPGDGPGRFWGYWGLERADLAVPLTWWQAVDLARTLRRWDLAQRGIRKMVVTRVNRATGQVRTRKVTRRTARLRGTAGFLVVNDGPGLAMRLADVIATDYGAGGRVLP